MRSRRSVLVIAPYLLIVLATSLGLWQLEQRDQHACHERAADRKVLVQVVDIATGNASGPVDLSKIGGFDTLDPSTQQYLRNLSAALTSANEPGQRPLHDRLTDLLPPITC